MESNQKKLQSGFHIKEEKKKELKKQKRKHY